MAFLLGRESPASYFYSGGQRISQDNFPGQGLLQTCSSVLQPLPQGRICELFPALVVVAMEFIPCLSHFVGETKRSSG